MCIINYYMNMMRDFFSIYVYLHTYMHTAVVVVVRMKMQIMNCKFLLLFFPFFIISSRFALGIAKNDCYFLYFNFIFVVVLLGSFLLQFILSFSHIFSLYLSVESILKTKVLNSFPISEL